jgi:flagellin-like hook-associated protein FlgL
MASVTLSAAVRQNLIALQNTSSLQATTQNRLATGKKVNSALDNPTSFFTAASLSARADQLSLLLDQMTNGVNTLQAADNGLTSITTTIQSLQATVTQARQDSSWQSTSYSIASATIGTTAAKTLGISGGAVTGTVNVALNTPTVAATLLGAGGFAAAGNTVGAGAGTFTVQAADVNGGVAVNVTAVSGDTVATLLAKINTATGANLVASNSGGQLLLTDAAGNNITIGGTVAGTGLSVGASANGVVGSVQTVDQLVTSINGNASLTGFVKASNNAGQLQITNLSTTALSLTGVTGSSIDGTAGTATIGANTVRANLVTTFNQLRDQLDKTAADSSFNGINLLNGDQLKLLFNETATSSLTIQSTAATGINNSVLGISSATNAQFQANAQLDTLQTTLTTALNTVRSQASAFGSNLAIVENRETFTKATINTLQNGAEGLTLADTNLEGANMLALQTRQQLSTTALSLANQANQSVLRLFA